MVATKNGIGTVHLGSASEIGKLSTSYHVLINLLSTMLLTSSNYCMQILCALSRSELDRAHEKGIPLDIGLMSLRNLQHIKRKRQVLWLILALSSFPLHLLYNSAIFKLTVAQNYNIQFFNASEQMSPSYNNYTSISNDQWTQMYETKFVETTGDLILSIDEIFLPSQLEVHHGSWNLLTKDQLSQNYTSGNYNIPANFTLDKDRKLVITASLNSTFQGNILSWPNDTAYMTGQAHIAVKDYSSSMVNYSWPVLQRIEVQNYTWRDYMEMDSNGWISGYPHYPCEVSPCQTDTNSGFHVDSAKRGPIRAVNSVQIALPFMVIVIVCNVLKAVAMYLTLRQSFSKQLMTMGDAVASYLEDPEQRTSGFSTLEEQELVRIMSYTDPPKAKPALWSSRDVPFWQLTIKYTSTNIVLIFAAITTLTLAIAVFVTSFGKTTPFRWGPSSTLQLPLARRAFDSSAIMYNAWLANTPQVLLSISYFAINRLCTTMCCAREWNSYAEHRKGLRVTCPEGKQRSTYFLQLPFRWTVPLTVASGVLHWLLSQSLFFIRLEFRDENGETLLDGSECTVGYSGLSTIIFGIIFFGMLIFILILALRTMSLKMPAALHNSFMVSAACHPAPDEVQPELKKVKWGVLACESDMEQEYCTFSSLSVTKPVQSGLCT